MLSVRIPSKTVFDDTVYKILQRSEYTHLKSAVRDFMEMCKDAIGYWLQKMLRKAFSNTKSTASISEKLSTVFTIVGILVILAILILIVVKVSKTFEKKKRVKEILGEKIDENTTPKSLKKQASIFAAQGDFRQAIRYDFIGLLLLMHEKNLLYLDETKTNEEIYNDLMKKEFSRSTLFKDLIYKFNSSWYGYKLGNKEEYEQWENSISLLWREVIKYEEKNK